METCGKAFLPIIGNRTGLARLIMLKAHKGSTEMENCGIQAMLSESKKYPESQMEVF